MMEMNAETPQILAAALLIPRDRQINNHLSVASANHAKEQHSALHNIQSQISIITSLHG